MYNNTITNTDVKVPVEVHVSLQLGNHGEKNKGNMHIYVVQFGFLFYICGVAFYWMINLFT